MAFKRIKVFKQINQIKQYYNTNNIHMTDTNIGVNSIVQSDCLDQHFPTKWESVKWGALLVSV